MQTGEAVGDRDGLTRAILESPADDAPRLVFADWLDDQGDEVSAAHAAYIRAAIEYAAWFDEHEQAPRANDARRRMAELLAGWFPAEWPIPPCPRYEPDRQYLFLKDSVGAVIHGDTQKPGLRVKFYRGFASGLICSAADWLTFGDRVLAGHPIADVHLTTRPVLIREPFQTEGIYAARGAYYSLGGRPSREVCGPDRADDGCAGRLLRREWPRITFRLETPRTATVV